METKSQFESQKNTDLKYWVAYSKIFKIGPINFRKLANYFVTMESAWKSGYLELKNAGITDTLIDEIITSRKNINPDAELELLEKENVKTITINEKNYPASLKEIFNPPPIIYYRGCLNFLNNICLAVVGTRKFSTYGKQVTEELVYGLAKSGITIISGLALGIDSIAHKACLDVNGKTIGILGSGVNKECVFPSTNRYIADKILSSGGAIVSEYPIGTMPTKYTFPMRNRIVSGLSRGVLVIEAPECSGTLITAKYALEQNRDIFAVPGNIYGQNSKGTNSLIKQGAKLVTCTEDILEEFNIQMTLEIINSKAKMDTLEEEIILKILSKEPTHVDKIKQTCKLNINVLLSTITLMEIKGIIKDVGGKNYITN